MSLKKLFEEHSDSNRIAVVHNDKFIRYSELYNWASTCHIKFKQVLSMRSHIAILLPDSISYVVAYCSILLSEHVIVPIYYKSTDEEIYNNINFCDVGLVITDRENKSRIISKKLEHIVFIMDIESFEIEQVGKITNQPIVQSNDDTVIMVGTSGSTSTPKRVELTNNNLMSNVGGIIDSLNYTSDEKFMSVLPLTMASGNTSQLLVSLVLGSTLYIFNDIIHPRLIFQFIEKYQITSTTIVPSILKSILDSPKDYSHQAKTLKTICFGGGPTDKATLNKLLNHPLCDKFVQMYGQTEASPRISHLHLFNDKGKLPSVGRPLKDVKVTIDETEYDGKNGEICVKGDNVMVGYYKEKYSPIINGWLATGDLGYIDNDGYIYITGRKKNTIIFSGMNIYPEDVENVICQNRKVEEALVYGISNEIYGEIPIAEVVLHTPGSMSEEELIAFCEERLASHKVPNKIIFVESLKRTYNGKIDRKRV
ncbi:MAG: acyl--CoA ligase [Ruminococcaceae bacterium]|nr:acyl--CoA ligase [Oscillospiraceae bacterium]